ncbi:MAG: hypothetical protein LH472_16005 [Pyrinomonadaceae bacterium]|nr:hypothetical protein [Pyrinomonadaceae bacterium]
MTEVLLKNDSEYKLARSAVTPASTLAVWGASRTPTREPDARLFEKKFVRNSPLTDARAGRSRDCRRDDGVTFSRAQARAN